MSEMLGNRYLLALRARRTQFPTSSPGSFGTRMTGRTAQKLAICHAVAGHPKTAVIWIQRALDSSTPVTRSACSDASLFEQLASEIREHRDDLGAQCAWLGLACAHLFWEPEAARADLDHVLEETPESDPLHALIETIESRLEVER